MQLIALSNNLHHVFVCSNVSKSLSLMTIAFCDFTDVAIVIVVCVIYYKCARVCASAAGVQWYVDNEARSVLSHTHHLPLDCVLSLDCRVEQQGQHPASIRLLHLQRPLRPLAVESVIAFV